MSDRYKFDETPQGPDFQGGANITASRTLQLAQLGARVLEILRSTVGGYVLDRHGYPISAKVAAIHDAARSLGLLTSDSESSCGPAAQLESEVPHE